MSTVNTTELSVPRRFRVAREIAGLTQDELAQMVGVARTTILDWEAGRTEPTFAKVVALSRATKQPLDWFAEGLDADTVRPKGLEPLTFWLGAWTAEDDAMLRSYAEAVTR